MLNKRPTTKAEAQKHRYGAWAGHPKGNPFDEKRCADEIMTQGRGALPIQCNRPPGHGPEGLYCKAHALEHFPGKSETWYKTANDTLFDWSVTEVEICHHTDKFVHLVTGNGSRKEAIKSEWGRYWKTKSEAFNYLIDRAKAKLARSIKETQTLTELLDYLQNNCPPPPQHPSKVLAENRGTDATGFNSSGGHQILP